MTRSKALSAREIRVLKRSVLAPLLLLAAESALAQQFPPQIKNVVIVYQENRTPDNLFHFLTPACPVPAGATGLDACIPSPVTTSCYDISPCGLSNQHGDPVPIKLKPASLSASVDPDHSHKGFMHMCDPDPKTFQCRDDGAWRTSPKNSSYAYVANTPVTNSDGTSGHLLDPYLALATQYGWANYMYQTNQGPSYPAHQFMFSGTSALTAEDDANSIFLAENPDLQVSSSQAGCLALRNGTNALVSPALGPPAKGCSLYDANSVQECALANTPLIYPTASVGAFCVSHQSMADLLDEQSISWKYYAASAGFIWTAPDAIDAICQPAWTHPTNDPKSGLECTGAEWKAHVDVKNLGTDILRDIANCNLAQVNWVIPDGRWSDHIAPYGPSWVASVVNAIGKQSQCPAGTADAGQTYWRNTAIVITWDDWGGWSDNQPAPMASALPCTSTDCQGDYQYGFRVPLIVVSAYTPPGFISNVPHDSASVLRMIEGINHIPEGQLGFSDLRATTDLEEFFGLTLPRPYITIPAQKDANYFLGNKEAPIDPDDD